MVTRWRGPRARRKTRSPFSRGGAMWSASPYSYEEGNVRRAEEAARERAAVRRRDRQGGADARLAERAVVGDEERREGPEGEPAHADALPVDGAREPAGY